MIDITNISLNAFCHFSSKEQNVFLTYQPILQCVSRDNLDFYIPSRSTKMIIDDLTYLISEKPDNWVRLLSAKKYNCILAGYIDWIKFKTPLLDDPKYHLKTKVYWILNDITEFLLCKNPMCTHHHILDRNVVSVITGYSSDYCCNGCAQASSEHQELMHKLALDKYGTNTLQSAPERVAKMKNTIKDHAQSDPQYWEKRNNKSRQTCLARYGYDNPNKVPEIHNRIIETTKNNNLQKFGVEFPLQSDEIHKKIQRTNLERYGVKYTFSNKDIQHKCEQLAWAPQSIEKRINTLVDRYGVTNSFQIQECVEKQRKALIEYFFSMQSRSTITFNFTMDEYFDIIMQHNQRSTQLSFHCTECGNDFMAIPFEHCYNYSCARCLQCHPLIIKGVSNEERDLKEFIKLNFPTLQMSENDRTMLINPISGKPLELDIWFPTLNKAIEFNGDYWHSFPDRIARDNIKQSQCVAKGISLLVITEFQWISCPESTKQIILEFLNENN